MAALVAITAITPSAIAQSETLHTAQEEQGTAISSPALLEQGLEQGSAPTVVTVADLAQPIQDPEVLLDAAEPITSTPSEAESVEVAAEITAGEGPPLSLYEPDAISQRPSVRGLSDVQPTDWAFQALRNLIENYGCLDGFSDGRFRGNQPISRFEFAAGLSACLDAIVQVAPDDIATVAQLQQDFAAELNTRVEDLEARVEELRADQFSTTTRLFGQAIFGLQVRNTNTADLFPVDGIRETKDPGSGDTTFYSSAQLSLLTQISRRSLLLLGIQAGEGNSLFDNQSNQALGLTNNVRLAYEADSNFDVRLSDLTYRHLVSDNLAVIAGAAGVDPISVFRGPNRYESAGAGPLSLFAQRNPILAVGNGNTGVGFDWQISDRLSLQGVYSVSEAADANNDGLFSGSYVTGLQFTASPNQNLNLALNYLHSYAATGDLGTGVGDSQITTRDQVTGNPVGIKTNAIGATVNWQTSPGLVLGTWGGYTHSTIPGESGSAETLNWMLFANFPDLFGPGNLGGLYFGQPPRITDSNFRQGQNIPNLFAGGLGDAGGRPGSTLHLEAFYRYQLTDNISITPGFIIIFEPTHTPASDTIAIGALRTTFTF
jgi:hypothetical protein